MEFVRIGRTPWGDEVLLGLAWDVLWLVVAAGVAFILFHGWFARKTDVIDVPEGGDGFRAGLPERIRRHSLSARLSHWALAASTLALLVTAFVPILGLKFPWLTVHWVAGVVLAAYVLYHVADTAVRLSWGRMWIGPREVLEAAARVRDFFARREDPAKRPGKWGTENKVFHHLTALAGLAVAGTGLLMMARIDTGFWQANPYFRDIPEATWGWVFVVHGASAVAFVGLLMAHVYFALRPDKLFFTRSMFTGWITRDEYLSHFSPKRWRVGGARPVGARPELVEAEPAGVGAAPSGPAAPLAGSRE